MRTINRSVFFFLPFALGACDSNSADDGVGSPQSAGSSTGAQSGVGTNTGGGTAVGAGGAGTATGAGGVSNVGVGGLANSAGGSGAGGAGTPGAGGAGTPGAGGSGAGGSDAGGAGGSAAGGSGPGAGGSGNAAADLVCPYTDSSAPDGSNWVGGDMLEFNDNGGWCWYQDERAIVDVEAGKIIIGSMASGGGRARQIEVVHWDIASGESERHTIGTVEYTDDHDTPAIVKRPGGGYIAMWAGHNNDCNSYYSVYDGSSWTSSKSFGWPSSGCPTSSGKEITYANMWYLDGQAVSYVRSLDTSPHYIYSDDDGGSWDLGGRLTSTPQVGYVAGYYKYWGNNTDRLDFFGTEAHPRDNDNSLYHGYIQGGEMHKSGGEVVDSDFKDVDAKDITDYSQVFKTGTTVDGVQIEHLWNADLVRYDDGTVAAIGTGRVSGSGSDDPDKRLLYFRFDGTEWKTTYLAKAGTKLYNDEQDYTGLGALDPDNPHIIYISTAFDPRTDEGDFNGKKEIWKGTSCDDGTTFDWEPVTANSTMDNLRPIVPKWDVDNTVVMWLRGTYTSAQSYDFEVVGLIESTP